MNSCLPALNSYTQYMHLIWHRTELRTHDNPALAAALERAASDRSEVLPIVVIDPRIFGRPDLTVRRQAWFLENTRALRESYRTLGGDLVVRRGEPVKELVKLVRELKGTGHEIRSVHFIRNYTPYAKERDSAARAALEKLGIEVCSYGGQYTHEPGEVLTQSGTSYTVHGPFLKTWRSLAKPEILPPPKRIPALPALVTVGEIPRVQSDIELPPAGEENAQRRLAWFLENGEGDYQKVRQFPALENKTSKLSYYFNLGVLSPRLAYSKAQTYKWKFELSWWDFFADLLDHNPESANQEAVPAWRQFPWRNDAAEFEKWKTGQMNENN